MKFQLSRVIDGCKFHLSTHFCRYKWLYIITAIFCLVFIIVGMCVIFGKSGSLEISDIPDKALLSFLLQDSGAFGMIFARIFGTLFLALAIWITNFRPIMCFLSIIIIMYRSFVLGATCALLIKLFQFGGIINVIIIYFPINLIVLFLLLSWACVCIFHNFEYNRYGKNILCREFVNEKQDHLFCTAIILLICIILEIIMLQIFSSAIIIN